VWHHWIHCREMFFSTQTHRQLYTVLPTKLCESQNWKASFGQRYSVLNSTTNWFSIIGYEGWSKSFEPNLVKQKIDWCIHFFRRNHHLCTVYSKLWEFFGGCKIKSSTTLWAHAWPHRWSRISVHGGFSWNLDTDGNHLVSGQENMADGTFL